jgi:mannose-6-phosphate isomerase-like protein (cupin superfamily)
MNLNDQQLVVAAFDGALDEKSFRRLQERLAGEPALLALYREHALLHHSLAEEFEGSQMIGHSVPSVARAPRWVPVFAACAAAVAIVIAAWQFLKPDRPAPVVAGCAFSADAIAKVDDRPALDGSGFSIGSRLSVERGWVRLNLPKKAVALIEAPASVVFEVDQVLRFESGRGRLHCPESARGFTVKSGSLVAVDHGTDFGIVSRPGAADELHVFSGEVAVTAVTGTAKAVLRDKEAAAIDGDGALQRMPSREEDFESLTPETRILLEDVFDTGAPLAGRRPVVGKSHWRLEKGTARLKDGHLEGSGFEAYFWLPADGHSASRPVLLVTLEIVAAPDFHTPLWAGLSLYQEGYEHCFFGDSFGPEETWSLDVKRRFVPVLPSTYLTGPRTMTLRYDRRDGTIELHEGASAGNSPVARSKIQPGLSMDQIRIGAAEGATLAVSKLSVRAVSEPPR